jgi:hypothetical protein
VTSIAHASGFDRSGQPHDQEARLLVQLLRTSRLSLLYAEGGADKTALLRLGLMPLLGRRTIDKAVPAVVRASGVVVPFPDRRGRSALRASKRRREMVVYFDGWNETPLAALREALHLATATGPAEQLAPSMRLGEVLDDLGRRMDAHLIVLLDRFEDLLRTPSQGPGHTQLMNELAEAVKLAELPASFLIAVDDDARSQLASLQARIPGFDDFSLKLAPRRDFKAPAAPRIVNSADAARPAPPVALESLPVLTQPLATPPAATRPLAPAPSVSTAHVPRRPKVKEPPLPRVQIRTEDVYAMIEEALSRIAPGTVGLALPAAVPEVPVPEGTGPSPSPASSDARAQTGCQDLQKAIERMEQRLRTPPDRKA